MVNGEGTLEGTQSLRLHLQSKLLNPEVANRCSTSATGDLMTDEVLKAAESKALITAGLANGQVMESPQKQ